MFQNRMTALESQVSQCKCGATPAHITDDIAALKTEFYSRIHALEAKITGLEERLERMERYRRRKTLLLHGAPEDLPVDAAISVTPLKIDNSNVGESYRIGGVGEKPRPILIKFKTVEGKTAVWKEKSKLKGSKWLLTESLTPLALQLLRGARERLGDRSVWTMGGNVFIKNRDNAIKKLSCLTDLNCVPEENTAKTRKLRQRSKKHS
jgi:hypothetical protein